MKYCWYIDLQAMQEALHCIRFCQKIDFRIAKAAVWAHPAVYPECWSQIPQNDLSHEGQRPKNSTFLFGDLFEEAEPTLT